MVTPLPAIVWSARHPKMTSETSAARRDRKVSFLSRVAAQAQRNASLGHDERTMARPVEDSEHLTPTRIMVGPESRRQRGFEDPGCLT